MPVCRSGAAQKPFWSRGSESESCGTSPRNSGRGAMDKTMSEDDLIKDIIKRYGEVLDLRKTPHLIIEIIRTFGQGIANVPDGGVSVAGVGSPPGPQQSGHTLGNV